MDGGYPDHRQVRPPSGLVFILALISVAALLFGPGGRETPAAAEPALGEGLRAVESRMRALEAEAEGAERK